jgi:Cdc6-like AAA superfamily ATPase
MKNPFNPSFGTQPTVLLDRDQLKNKLVADIKEMDTPYRTTLIYGNRGVGKTVFMNSVGEQIAADPDWLTLHLIIGDNMVGRLTEMIYQQSTKKIKKIISKLDDISIGLAGLNLKFNLADKQTSNYQYVLSKMLKVLKEHQQKVLVMIDEAQDVPGMVELASVYQVMISENLPISIIMTGLPKNVQELQNNHVLTFLLRSGRVNLSPLNYYDIKNQYQEALQKKDPDISPAVIREAALLSDGYAYAFQLLGYLLWNSDDQQITMATLKKIKSTYQAELSRNAYGKMLEELSPMDQRFIIAMAKAPDYPVSTAYLGEVLHKKPGYIGMYRRRLLDSQMIATAGYGKIKFALPLFKEFLLDDGQYLVEFTDEEI